MSKSQQNRRQFIVNHGKLALGAAALPVFAACQSDRASAPAIIIPDGMRPKLPSGIQIGDVQGGNAMIWARADRAAKLRVEYDFTDQFKNSRLVTGAVVTDKSDFTGRVQLTGLPEGQTVFLRVSFEDAQNADALSELYTGRFQTASLSAPTSIRFVWGGDVAGQGWGINPDFGGMKIFETMRKRTPDFFIHSGDTIYADGPILPSVTLDDGRIWRNLVTDEVSKVAETLTEFRGRYRYNLMDENVRRFAAEVPQLWQWDDHEIVNNWSPSKDLSTDGRYSVKDINTLVTRGRQAFLEYAPMHLDDVPSSDQRIYRKVSYGPLLDVFMLDMRSYRAGNGTNVEPAESDKTAFMGKMQVDWLINELAHSKAIWKVIAADMPIGLQVPDGKDSVGTPRWEAIANGKSGAPLGRELELAGLLSAIKSVQNIVWLTADVHYCAAHYYDNNKAKFTDFSPFWEFVAGPLNAGSFGPNALDDTFGPQVIFQKAPPVGKANLSPLDGLQFFGEINIDALSKVMSVSFRNINDELQFTQELIPKLG